jgi:hypothetical protein
MRPAVLAPPRKCMRPLAQGAWKNFNGRPVMTRPRKVNIIVEAVEKVLKA